MFCNYGILPLLLDGMGMLPYWYVTGFSKCMFLIRLNPDLHFALAAKQVQGQMLNKFKQKENLSKR